MKEFPTTRYEIAERVDIKITYPKIDQNDPNKNFLKPIPVIIYNIINSSKNSSF